MASVVYLRWLAALERSVPNLGDPKVSAALSTCARALAEALPEGPVLPEATPSAPSVVAIRIGDVDVPQAILEDFPPVSEELSHQTISATFAMAAVAAMTHCTEKREYMLCRTRLQEAFHWASFGVRPKTSDDDAG